MTFKHLSDEELKNLWQLCYHWINNREFWLQIARGIGYVPVDELQWKDSTEMVGHRNKKIQNCQLSSMEHPFGTLYLKRRASLAVDIDWVYDIQDTHSKNRQAEIIDVIIFRDYILAKEVKKRGHKTHIWAEEEFSSRPTQK